MRERWCSAVTYTPTPREAFMRLETVEDFHDLALLFLSGVNVGFEPVTGSLTGFQKPLHMSEKERAVEITTVRNLLGSGERLQEKSIRARRENEEVLFVSPATDSPASIAKAFRVLLANKSRPTEITFDLTALKDAKRARIISDALISAYTLLNYRGARLLSVTDIVDLVAPLATLGCARLDAQVRYGSASWGAFVRGESDSLLERITLPVTPNYSRTLVCGIRPTSDDLTLCLENGVGVVNAKAAEARGFNVKGLNPAKSLLLGNHIVCETGEVDVTDTDSVEARWQALQAAGGDLYQITAEPLPKGLQSVWTCQRETFRSYAVSVRGVTDLGELESLGLKALKGGNDAATRHGSPWPRKGSHQTTSFEGSAVEQLEAQRQWLVFSDNCGTVVRMKNTEAAGVCDWLLREWDRFVAAGFEVIA